MPGTTYDAYPNSDDVLALMSGAGITVPDNIDVDSFVNETIDEWEAETEYKPFWVDPSTAAADYSFNPPGPNTRGCQVGGAVKLLLDRGFVSIASVTTGVSATDAGTVLVENTDYWLLPSNYAADGVPITEILFARQQWGAVQSIVVNGVAGYGTILTSDVWNALRKMAAAKTLKGMREQLASDGISMEKSGDDQIAYDAKFTMGDTWDSEGRAVMIRKTLVR